MRHALTALWMLACTPVLAQLSINFGSPGVSIGVNLGTYPTLQRVPGYPVYYAPSLSENYFFYDGLYWVYERDNWYASSWYNGPWTIVDPMDVPVYLLRVPVRYYRQPPAYFRGWSASAAPRWGDHWGNSWQERRSGWDRWDRKSAPAPAPLPTYQRQYTGSRYPQASQQAVLETRNYRYQPKDPVAQQNFRQRRTEAAPQAQQAAPQRVARPAPQQRQQQEVQPPQARAQPPQPVQPREGKERQQPAKQPPNQAEQKARPAPPAARENAPDGKERGKGPDRERDDNEKGNRGGRER